MYNNNAGSHHAGPDDRLRPDRKRTRSASPPTSVKRERHSTDPEGEGSSNMNGQHSSLPPLSLSILGVEPTDEFIREIADWIYAQMMVGRDMGGEVEVEARLGVLKFNNSEERLNYPVLVETILAPDDNSRFESNMTASQHKHFNTLLNGLEQNSRKPDHPASEIRHVHTYLVDSFYPSGQGRDKVRVTHDEKTNELVESIKKVRIATLEVFSPKRPVDWRIGVNVEIPVMPPTGQPSFKRRKDRISYQHEEFVIDLTQVTQTGNSTQVTHELELEIARPSHIMALANVRGNPNVSPQQRDAFDEVIRAFVNNIRILVRNAKPT